MKNKLLLLSAALFGAVSFGNYVHSMDLTHDMEKREVCIKRLKEVGEVSSILINKKLNTTKEDFDFICQKDPSIIYQGLAISLQHTNSLHIFSSFSTGEAIENYKFVISNIIQRIETNHEGLVMLKEALPIFSELEKYFSSNTRCSEQFENNLSKLDKIFSPILKWDRPTISFDSDCISAEEYKYGYEKNSIEYAIKYNDTNSIIEIQLQPNFNFNHMLGNMSFLDFAAFHGSVDAFKFFSLNNLPVTERTCAYSIIGGNHEIVQFCKQQNDCFGNVNCLYYSVIFHRYDITNWLMQNHDNSVILRLTVKYGDINTFLKIIQDPSYDLNESKILHKCCEYNRKEIAEILLIDGADVNDSDKSNRKPIDIVQTDEMRDLLRQYGAN